MTHYQQLLKIRTTGKSLSKVTAEVVGVVKAAGIATGLCTLFLRHTSASLVIQENSDPDVLQDLESFFSRLVPEGPYYCHSTEGPDDMPAHLRTVLTQTQLTIPLDQGRLLLGTWQGIYLWEHRQQGSLRELVVHISGD
jgi:secondary thiamine-phosphate synthase enzyme